jgi:thioredoxin 1
LKVIFNPLSALGLLSVVLLGALTCGQAVAGEGPFPYDETANAETDVAAAEMLAKDSNRFLLINFGANWCPDCRALASALASEPLASRVAEHFVSVRVDVGNWDKHQALSKRYGDPAAQGIPAVAVVDTTGAVRYTTQAGELATARNMGDEQLLAFFETLIANLEQP